MASPNFTPLWEYNYYSRNPKYTLRGKLLTSPVATLVCLCPEIDNPMKPLRMYPIRMNSETGLIEHTGCYKPIPSAVLNCNGCFEDFWGCARELACIECLPYM